MIQITYQKRNGYVFQRLRNTPLTHKIGDTTSMGWKILNIEYQYKNKYYSYYDYYTLIRKRKERHIKKQQFKQLFLKDIKTLLYNIIGIMILYYIKIRLGI